MVGNENLCVAETLSRKRKCYFHNKKGPLKKEALVKRKSQAIPTLAWYGGHTTIGRGKLNCRVRDGTGCFLSAYPHLTNSCVGLVTFKEA